MKKSFYLLILLNIVMSSCEEKYEQQFVKIDIENFWEAFDKIQTTNDTLLQLQYVNDLYVKKGSDGLKNMIDVKNYTPEEYLRVMKAYPAFWKSIRESTLNSEASYQEINNDIQKLKNIYPDLKPATIFFTVGAFRSNGTIKDSLILIGCEMALAHKGVEVNELPISTQEYYKKYNPIDDISFLCTHEYVHTQQKPVVDNLLSYAIYEGVPEFVATLATGKKPYLSGIEFGESNYVKVRNKFEEDLFISRRTYNWLWSTNHIFGERDLGYGVGYGMARQYYEKADDKKLAIKEMIELDFSDETAVEAFVDGSGYLSKPIQQLNDEFESARPVVSKITGIKRGSRNVASGTKNITLHFSKPLDGVSTSVDLGPKGKDAFPKLELERVWAEDKKSWTITANLEANKHYQILISNNFRLDNGLPLKPYLIEFWTSK